MTFKWAYGIDTSFDLVTPQEVARIKASGVQVAVQCLWTGREQPGARVINLRRYLEGGLKVAAYISINSVKGSGVWHINQGRSGVPDDIWSALEQCAVDVELRGIHVSDIQEAGRRVVGLSKPKLCYTSWNVWMNYLVNDLGGHVRDPREFSEWLLWNAFWDGSPDIDFPSAPFGDWKKLAGEQWSGGTNLHGIFADRNQFDATAFGLHEGTTDEPRAPKPTDAQYLHSAATMAQVTELFATRNHLFEGAEAQELRNKAKFLLRL